MKTIKFRAWDKKKRVISVIRSWDFAHGDIELGKELVPEADKFEEELEIMQFTGLLDKNGKEIYEGDIVKIYSGNHYEVKFGKYLLEGYRELSDNEMVDWEESAYGWYIDGDLSNTTLGSWMEVIGNIYEHSELLTK